VSGGLPYLVVPVKSQQAVRKARFDIKAWSQSSAPAMAAQEYFYCLSPKTNSADSNFHARLLGPNIGFNEDPPIGSAMPTFAGYLASHDHIREGTYSFAIDRGTTDTRRSLLHIEMDKHASRPVTLRVGGDSVLVSKCELFSA
jgi:Predicted epimerase, PhzC/PhzF homolog